MIDRPWTCPTDGQWARFVFDMPATERAGMVRHLETCDLCRIVVAEKKREMDDLEAVWSASGRSNVIYLSVWADSRLGEPDATLLAAKGGDELASGESATLSSPGQELLLRLVRDGHSNELWLFLLSDDEAAYRNAIVKPFGEVGEFVTDDRGRVNLGVRPWPKVEALTAEVRLPTATFLLSPLGQLDVEGQSAVLNSSGGDKIKVSFAGEGRNRRLEIQILQVQSEHADAPLKIALRRGAEGALSVQPLAENRAAFENVEPIKSLEIYLYQ